MIQVSQDVGYQVFATFLTFYIPLLCILFLYWRIFLTARNRLRNRLAQKARVPQASIRQSSLEDDRDNKSCKKRQVEAKVASSEVKTVLVKDDDAEEELEVVSKVKTTTFSTIEEDNSSPVDASDSSNVGTNGAVTGVHSPLCPKGSARSAASAVSYHSQGSQTDRPRGAGGSATKTSKFRRLVRRHRQVLVSGGSTMNGSSRVGLTKEKKHVSLEAKRERKAAKTLAIVTGAFIACWLPFFILALLMPILKDQHEFDQRLISFFLWLGYFNSTLNPIIYTVFSPEFRQAFQRILFGKVSNPNHRPRHLQ